MTDSTVFNGVLSAPLYPIKVIANRTFGMKVKVPRKEKSWKNYLHILENSWKSHGNLS